MQQDKTWKNIAPLFANMIFGSWYLLVGGLLALHMSLLNVVITLLIGNVLAAFLFFLVGNIGSKLRLSTYEIAKSSFGKYGSRFLITVLLVAARIGWVAVRAELGGLALAYILGIPNSIGIIIFAVALIIATIGSFKNLSIYGWIALACTIGLSIIGLSTIFQNYQINSALVNNQASTWSIFTGINVVLISKISLKHCSL